MTDKVIKVKIDAGDSKAQIDSLDKSMVQLGTAADKTASEIVQLNAVAENTATEVAQLGVAANKTATEISHLNQVNTQTTKTAQAVSQALNTNSNAIGDIGRKAGMAGMQIQQFVGQVTAGTSPMVALSQQAADLGFVLGAPLLGAVLGISAAIASVLLPSLIGGKSEVEKLDEALKNLKDTSGTTEDGIYVLNEQIIRLAKASEAAARVKLTANIMEARDAAIQASRAFDEAFDAGRLQFAVDTYASGVAGIVGVSAEVTGVTREIGQQFGLQGQAAIKFGTDVVRAIGEIQKAPTTGAFDKFSNLISNQATASGTSGAVKLAGALLDLADKGRIAAEQIDSGNNALKDLSAALNVSDAGARQTATSMQTLTQQLEVQNVALKQGELAGLLQAAANRAQVASVDELDPKIRALIIENYNLEQSQKATAQAASDLTKEINAQAEADKRAAERSIREQQRLDQRIANMRLETETLSSETLLQQAVLDGKFSYEESQLAAQTASKIMAATTEYEQLQALAGEDSARKLEAEAAFKAQIAAINEQYAMGQDELDLRRLMMAEDAAQRIRDANVSAFSSGVSIMESFLGRSNGIVKAARLAMGAYQAFSIYASSQAAAVAALAPPPLGLGPIAGADVASAILLSGKLSAAAVLAGAASSAFAGSGGGGFSVGGGGASAGSATLPTTPQSAPTVGAFEIVGLAGLQDKLDRLDNDEVLPVSFTKRLVASLESVQRLQGA